MLITTYILESRFFFLEQYFTLFNNVDLTFYFNSNLNHIDDLRWLSFKLVNKLIVCLFMDLYSLQYLKIEV